MDLIQEADITKLVKALNTHHLLQFIGDDLGALFLEGLEKTAIEIANHNPTEELETLIKLYKHQQETK